MKDNLASKDVVAKAVLTPPDAPLAFAWLQACQLLDGMPSGAAVRVCRENGNQFFESI